jgi:Predicted transcriptional regulators
MPISVETHEDKTGKIEVAVFISEIAELIAIVNILADNRHHGFAKEWPDQLHQSLSDKDHELLEQISFLPYQGLEFYELLLNCRIFNGIDEFLQKITAYENEDFNYFLCGEEIPREKIKAYQNRGISETDIIREFEAMPWMLRENTGIFEYILLRTDDFKKDLVGLFRDVYNNSIFGKMMADLKHRYGQSVEHMKERLASCQPMEMAQEILHRKISVEPSVGEFIFIPSNFIGPHYMMAFNKSSRMFIYDMNPDRSIKRNEERERLAQAFKIISDKTRLEILRLLILQPVYGKLLADRLELTTATISHHLEQLKSLHLIKESRDQNIKHFSVDLVELETLFDELKNYLYNR